MAAIPVDALRTVEGFGPHLSAPHGLRLSTSRAGAPGEDALLLLWPAVRDSAEGPGQRGDRVRAVGGLSVQPRYAVPEGRQALPAGRPSRSPDHRRPPRSFVCSRIPSAAVR